MLHNAEVIFWDFDGVIKESVEVKTAAYVNMFLPYGEKIASRVHRHHQANGGQSRFEKIPLYLNWAGEAASLDQIEKCCRQFSEAVVEAVVNSLWVPGVRNYLLKKHKDTYFVLVSATPQSEIEYILSTIELTECFREVFGAPTIKAQAIESVLNGLQCNSADALMIGDSKSDLLAAQANNVPFLLRRTPFNVPLQANFHGTIFDDLNDE